MEKIPGAMDNFAWNEIRNSGLNAHRPTDPVHANSLTMPPPSGSLPRNAFWAMLVVVVIFWASSHGRVAAPGVTNFDKIAHFSIYGLLATLLVRLGPGRFAFAWALVATSLYGASDEWHQSFVPGRSCDVFDWVADTAGGALAITLYTIWPWYRARLESRIGPKRRIENPAPVPTVPPA